MIDFGEMRFKRFSDIALGHFLFDNLILFMKFSFKLCLLFHITFIVFDSLAQVLLIRSIINVLKVHLDLHLDVEITLVIILLKL